MAALAGWDAALYITGTPTGTTGEAAANTTGFEYRITDADKRIIDPRIAAVVKENGVTSVKTITIDYLHGLVTFDSAPTEPVTVDYTYIPRARVGCPKSVTIQETREQLDRTCMKLDGETDAGVRKRFLGLFDAMVDMSYLEIMETPVDATDRILDAIRNADTDDFFVVEVQISTVKSWRGFVIPNEHSVDVSIEDVVSGTFSWGLATFDGAGYFSEVDYAA